eukprot:scaffold133984_cov29-Tisochrysis_lutea.AAC.1
MGFPRGRWKNSEDNCYGVEKSSRSGDERERRERGGAMDPRRGRSGGREEEHGRGKGGEGGGGHRARPNPPPGGGTHRESREVAQQGEQEAIDGAGRRVKHDEDRGLDCLAICWQPSKPEDTLYSHPHSLYYSTILSSPKSRQQYFTLAQGATSTPSPSLYKGKSSADV